MRRGAACISPPGGEAPGSASRVGSGGGFKLGHLAAIFLVISFCLVVAITTLIVVRHERSEMLEHAEHIAGIILEQNLSIHKYFTERLEPRLFAATGDKPPGHFDPVWMSSTYAVREIYKGARGASHGDYYYKEFAVNARSPENEADEVERGFIRGVNGGGPASISMVREIGGVPYFTLLRKGEVMEGSCLVCHGAPDRAPSGLTAIYGSERSFHRRVGEVVSAVSIRVPLGAAYADAAELSRRLSGALIMVFALLLVSFAWFLRRFYLKPIAAVRDKALRIAGDRHHLESPMPEFHGREFRELADAFNVMSGRLLSSFGELSERFNLFMAHLPGIAVIKDASGRYLFVNETWKECTGLYRDEEWFLKSSLDIWPSEIAENLLDHDRKALLEQSGVRSVDPISVDGVTRYMLNERFLLKNTCHEMEYVGVIGVDITERIELEELLRAKQAQLDAAAMEVTLAEERERRRIAGELHDQVGQSLVLARMKISVLSMGLAGEEIRESLHGISELLGRSLQDIRTLTCRLSPPLLGDIGLKGSLEWLASQMLADYGLKVVLSDDGEEKPLDSDMCAALYLAARELLINVAKHAAADLAFVSLERDVEMIITRVEDRGEGFDPEVASRKLPSEGGFGLINIRRRIEHLGGMLWIDSSPGKGTRATISLPVASG